MRFIDKIFSKHLAYRSLFIFFGGTILFIQCKDSAKEVVGPKRLVTVSTLNAIAWDQTSITVQGSLSSTGNDAVTERGFTYGKTLENIDETKISTSVGSGPFSIKIEGLTEGTLFYFRAYAKNSQGTAYGEPMGVATTYGPLSSIKLNSISTTKNEKDTLLFDATVLSKGGTDVFERGVILSLSANKSISDGGIVVKSGSDVGNFSGTYSSTSFKSNTTYFVKAYSKNKAGVAYSDESQITTPGLSVISHVGYNFKNNAIELDARINIGGGLPILEQGFVWGPKSAITSNNSNLNISNANLTVSNISLFQKDKIVISLDPSQFTVGEIYKFRAFTRNLRGITYAPVGNADKDAIYEFRYLPIGGELQEGYIFWVDPEKNTDGAIVSKLDLNDEVYWGCNGDSIGTTTNNKDFGKANTTIMANACSDPNSAAKKCRALASNSSNNTWNIPSRDALKLIYDTLGKRGLGNFDTSKKYWSSSQSTESRAYSVSFADGLVEESKKYLLFKVRPIRSIIR